MYINLKRKFFSLLSKSSVFFTLVFSSSYLSANQGLEIIYYGSRDEMALLGLGQGLEDSSNLYQGLKFRLKTETENFRPYDPNTVKGLFVSMGGESLRILSTLNNDIPIFNLVDDTDQVREMCMKNVFHILPSESMRDEAISLWKIQHEDDKEKDLSAVAWDSHIDSGKVQLLNEKFSLKRSIELSEQGWSGWAAARIFSDAYAQAHKDKVSVIDVLKNGISSDLFKGIAATFRTDSQLLQPVYIKDDDTIIGQIPATDDDEKILTDLGLIYCN